MSDIDEIKVVIVVVVNHVVVIDVVNVVILIVAVVLVLDLVVLLVVVVVTTSSFNYLSNSANKHSQCSHGERRSQTYFNSGIVVPTLLYAKFLQCEIYIAIYSITRGVISTFSWRPN